jgi:hypothetical protein
MEAKVSFVQVEVLIVHSVDNTSNKERETREVKTKVEIKKKYYR